MFLVLGVMFVGVFVWSIVSIDIKSGAQLVASACIVGVLVCIISVFTLLYEINDEIRVIDEQISAYEEDYVANNAVIEELENEKNELSREKWWLYFGK